MERFSDANIFLRGIITGDPSSPACAALWRRVGLGRERVFTTEAVIAEVIYVLTAARHYHLQRADAATRVRGLVTLRGLRIPDKARVVQALDLYARLSLDFVDCLAVAHTRAEGLAAIYSYDRALDRIPGVLRQEP